VGLAWRDFVRRSSVEIVFDFAHANIQGAGGGGN